MSQSHILFVRDTASRTRPLEVVIPSQGGSLIGPKELKNLISDLFTILHRPVIALPQLFDTIGRPSNHCSLIEESDITVTLSDPLHLELLPPKNLFLSQKRMVGGKHTPKIDQLTICEPGLQILMLLEI